MHRYSPSNRNRQRLIYQIFCANVALNSLFNVQCLNYAVGDTEGTVLVPVLNPASDLNFGGVDVRQFENGEPIKKITIDSLGLPACHFIKLDFESMEILSDAASKCSAAQ